MSKKRKKRSIIWKMPLDEFESLVKNSTSYREILKSLSMETRGSSWYTLKKRIKEDNIDDDHIKNKPRGFNAWATVRIPADKIFVENSPHGRHIAKKRIIQNELLDHTICSECGLKNIWNGKPLVMVLDHINGINNDHRLENLRFLCSNCNSQMPTFAGRKNKIIRYCSECGKEKKKKQSKLCRLCQDKSKRKVEWPEKHILKKDINDMSWCAIGRKYGVTDNAIRKWAKKYKLI
jgi:hypothetical protein